MPEQNDKPIERALRSYKKGRSKDAPLPLHPATRKMLQSEVARTYPSKTWDLRRTFRAFWPQIAFGSGLCAILIIAVLSLRVRHPDRESEQRTGASVASAPAIKESPPVASELPPSKQLASRDERLMRQQETESLTLIKKKDDSVGEPSALGIALSEERSSRGPQAPAPAEQPTRAFSKDLAETAGNSITLQDQSKKREAEAKAQADSPTIDAEKTVALNRGLAPDNKPTASASNVDKLSKANELTNLGAAIRLRFVEVSDTARREVKAPILTSFQVEQSGSNLQFLDSDGSIYTGQLTSQQAGQTAADSSFGRNVSTPAPQLKYFPGAASNEDIAIYSFFAQGTNRTLRAPVVLQGNYLERTNNVPSPEKTFSFSTNNPRAAASTANPRTNRSRHAITGKAIVGQTNEIPIKAISAE